MNLHKIYPVALSIFFVCICLSHSWAQVHYETIRQADLVHVQTNLDISIKDEHVKGWIELTFRPLSGFPKTLDLQAKQLNIHSVAVQTTQLEFVSDQSGLHINLPEQLQKLPSITLHIAYDAHPKNGMFFFPDANQMWTQGEPQTNSYWMPLYDYPNDKASSESTVRIKKGLELIGNGSLVSKKQVGELTEFHYLEKVPHSTYLISLAAGPFELVKTNHQNIELWFAGATTKTILERNFSKTGKMIDYLSSYIDTPYPFTKYAQTAVEDFAWGGMENVSATTLNDILLFPNEEAKENQIYADMLIAHELAHQWFGDYVTCANWSHVWLNEGFATFFEKELLGHLYGSDEKEFQFIEEAVDLIEHPVDRATTTNHFSQLETLFDSAVYGRGAWILRMLQYKLGSKSFKAAIQQYIKAYATQTATTEDLIRIFEQEYGRSLQTFTDQWLKHSGFLNLTASYTFNTESKSIVLNLEQKPIQGTNQEYYQIELPIWYEQDSQIIKSSVSLSSNHQTFVLPAKASPQWISIDPEWTVLRKIYVQEHSMSVLEHLYNTQHPTLMRDALFRAQDNAASGSLLRRALLDSKNPEAIKLYAAWALRQPGLAKRTETLFSALNTESSERVRHSIVESLGKYPSADTVTKLLQHGLKESSTRVRAKIAQIAAQEAKPNTWSLTQKLLTKKSFKDRVNAAFLDGLTKSHWLDAFNHTKAQLDSKIPSIMRAAIRAYGAFGQNKDKAVEIRSTLMSFLGSPEIRTVATTLSALKNLPPDVILEDIKTFAPPTEEIAAVKEEVLKKLAENQRSPNDAKVMDLQKKIENLEKAVENLEKGNLPKK